MDFVPMDVQTATRRGPPRTCLADDLAFYLSTHSNLVEEMTPPDAVAFFAKKIVASHYTQGVDYFRR